MRALKIVIAAYYIGLSAMRLTNFPTRGSISASQHTNSMKQTPLLICLLLSLSLGTGASNAQTVPLQTISKLDVNRYMGTWYEIAKYPNWFQKKCKSNTRAQYSLQADGTVQVDNSCTTETGEVSQAIGQARPVGAAGTAKLEVRFAPAWLSFIPLVWGDYWVIDLDAQYQLVAVSEPKREYLWILSRTPAVNPAAYDALTARLAQNGFDLKKLEVTRQ
jgi:apolipoprotein D and lipocalin family protein